MITFAIRNVATGKESPVNGIEEAKRLGCKSGDDWESPFWTILHADGGDTCQALMSALEYLDGYPCRVEVDGQPLLVR